MLEQLSDDAIRANDVFASFYDDFTAGHDHADWAHSLETLALAAGLRGRRLLDLACGTGNSFLPLLARGYSVTACDASEAMVERAREKAGPLAAVLVADIRRLPALGSFDLVWCLGDALGYMRSEADLTAAFIGVRQNLAPGGVFVFDVNTLATFRTGYSSLLVRPDPAQVLILDGRGRVDVAPGGESEVWIERLTPQLDGTWRRERSVHRHRHHPPDRVRACLQAAGLQSVGEHGSHLTGQLDVGIDEAIHVKAVYLARHDVPEWEERR